MEKFRLVLGYAITAVYVSSFIATLIVEGYQTPVQIHVALITVATGLFGIPLLRGNGGKA